MLDSQVYNGLIIAGIIQGLIFAGVVLFSPKHRNTSNYYLVALIISFSYNNLQFFLMDSGIVSSSVVYKTFYLPTASLNPALLLLYVYTSFEPEINWGRKLKWLFIPFLIFLGVVVTYKLYHVFADMDKNTFLVFKRLQAYLNFISFLFAVVVIGFAYVRVRKFRNQNKSANRRPVAWLEITLLLLLGLTILWGYALFKYLGNMRYNDLFKIIWVCLSAVIYWLGHRGVYSNTVFLQRKNLRKAGASSLKTDLQTSKNGHAQTFADLMVHQQRFKDSTVTLETVAEELGLSKSHLSRIINSELQTSFTQYINTLRVEEAKIYLANPEYADYKIVSVGLEAGFKSKTTFNTTFKSLTGLTPSEFKKLHL